MKVRVAAKRKDQTGRAIRKFRTTEREVIGEDNGR